MNTIFYHNNVIVKKIIAFFIFLSILANGSLSAQNKDDAQKPPEQPSEQTGSKESVLPSQGLEEAQPALFDMDIGDTDVDFYLSGSWKSNLSGSLGIGYSPARGILFPAAPSGISTGFRFSQHPDRKSVV